MAGEIDQYNTAEVLPFLMVSDHDDPGPPPIIKGITGIAGLVPGVSLIVTLVKNGAVPVLPAGAITEEADGYYHIAANAVDADTPGTLRIHAIGTGCYPTDKEFDVEAAFAPAPPVEPGEGGPVESRLALTPAQAKAYLRVEHDADNDLITALITSAKQAADDYLNNAFEVLRAVIVVNGAAVGDTVYVDGMTFRVAASAPATRTQDVVLQDFAIGADDAGTAVNLAAIINDEMYGSLNVLATQDDTEIELTWRKPKREPVTASEVSTTLSVRARRTQLGIPEAVRNGVLRTIAALYDQRQDGVSAQAISGRGSTSYGAPPIAYTLWAPHRKNPGT